MLCLGFVIFSARCDPGTCAVLLWVEGNYCLALLLHLVLLGSFTLFCWCHQAGHLVANLAATALSNVVAHPAIFVLL